MKSDSAIQIANHLLFMLISFTQYELGQKAGKLAPFNIGI